MDFRKRRKAKLSLSVARRLERLVPLSKRRSFRERAVGLIYGRGVQQARRDDGNWICYSAKTYPGINYIWHQDANYKRFTKNNYFPILTDILSKGSVIIDVGASYGDEVVDMAKLTGEGGHVYAFEPLSHEFEALQRTVLLNGFTNVTCINQAVSSRSGFAELTSEEATVRGIRESPTGGGGSNVVCTTLDTFWKEKGGEKVDLLKVDTDGHEIDVFKGARDLIRSNPQMTILAEFLPSVSYGSRFGKDVLRWYREQGLKVYKIQQAMKELNEEDDHQFCKDMNDPRLMVCHDLVLRKE